MKDYVILTETTSDLTPEQIANYELEVIPMAFYLDEKEYVHYPDAKELPMNIFYDKLKNGSTAKTSQITSIIYKDIFKKFLDNHLDIMYIVFSSALSSTYNSAIMAAKELKEEYPNSNIEVIDSKCASMGEGLLCYYASLNKKNGFSLKDNVSDIEDKKNHLCHWFCVDDLNHLKRGGRVSSAAALFGTMINIKPILHVDNEGRLIPVDKVRGRKQSIIELFKHMQEKGVNLDGQVVFISHGDCEEDALYLASLVKENYNVNDIMINYIGPIIGTHSGPGTLALFFLGKDKNK